MRRAERGMALIAALFMIIVMAVLGVIALRIGASEEQATSLEVLTARANAVAFSGLEYAANRVIANNGCAPPVPPPPPPGTPYVYPGLPPMGAFTFTVTCTELVIPGAPAGFRSYDLSATAVAGTYGRPDYVKRRLDRRVGTTPTGARWGDIF